MQGYAVSTIFNYISALPSFYAGLGLSVSLSGLECPSLALLKRGIRRLATPSRGPKTGLTPQILLQFRAHLNLTRPFDLALWACLLVGFFSFLRASNLVPKTASDGDGLLFLRRCDCVFEEDGVCLHIRRAKTNQFGSRKVVIPIPRIPSSDLCPVLALKTLFQVVRVLPNLPAFSYRAFRWLSYSDLLKGIKSLVELAGLDPKDFGTHSLRRGGATYAASCGVPAYYIKLQGDWASDCYTRYIALSPEAKMLAPFRMRDGVLGSL